MQTLFLLIPISFSSMLPHMIIILIIAILIALFSWSALLPFYKERHTKSLTPNIDNVFENRCLPIELEHDELAESCVIMVHGYPSTPYTYDWASHYIHQQGYDVFVPLLPGFGTDPKELLNTTFTQWYNYLESYYLEKRAHYNKVFVVGTSMGGSMTLKIAEKFSATDQSPDAIVTVAAPVFLNDIRLGVIHKFSFYLMRIVALFTYAINPKIYRGSEKQNDGEELWIGYSGSFVRGGVSLMYNLKEIRANLAKITIPMMAMHDENDRTIAFQNLAVIQNSVSSKHFISRKTKISSNHNRHILLMYPSIRHDLTKEMLSFFDSIEIKKE